VLSAKVLQELAQELWISNQHWNVIY